MDVSGTNCDFTFPKPSEQPIEVDYLENRRPDIYDGERYDVVSKRFARPIVREDSIPFDLRSLQDNERTLLERTSTFAQAVEKLQRDKGRRDKTIAEFNLDNAHSWQDVISTVQAAEKTYLDEKKLSGKVRTAFRKVGGKGEALKPFVGLLPDGSYKTLCGGLTLILGAMIRHAEIIETMADLLNRVPDFVELCENYINIYPGQDRLRFLGQELYINLLLAMEEIINWYSQTKMTRIGKALLQGPMFAQSIDKYLASIDQWQLRLQRITNQYLHSQLKLTDRTVNDIREDTVRIRNTIDGAPELLARAAHESTHAAVVNGMMDVLGNCVQRAKWFKALEHEKQAKSRIEDLEAKLRLTKDKLREKTISPTVLAQKLGMVIADDDGKDVAYIERVGTAKDFDFQCRSRWVAERPQIQTWVTAARSRVLAVNGSGDQEPVSPMSFFAGVLAKTLQGGNGVLVLTFFCGLHKPKGSDGVDGHEPLVFLLRHLLSQILSAQKVRQNEEDPTTSCLSFLNETDMLGLRAESFHVYLAVVLQLIETVRSIFDAIFIIIDGIDYYDKRWRTEVEELMEGLVQISESSKVNGADGVLKVLLLASARSLLFRRVSGKTVCKLDMPGDLDDERGFDARVYRKMRAARRRSQAVRSEAAWE